MIHFLAIGLGVTACGKPGYIGVVRADLAEVTCPDCLKAATE